MGGPPRRPTWRRSAIPAAELSDSEFERLAILHPLAQLELGGRVRPRHVRGRSPGGGLLCATAIPENAAVAFGEQSPHGVRSSALAALRDALAQLPGPARAALVFDCAARRSVLGIDPQAEVDVLTSALGSDIGRSSVSIHGARSRARAVRPGISTMPSSSSLSPDERDGLLRRFLVASRRGEIVALINARSLGGRPWSRRRDRAVRGVRRRDRLRARRPPRLDDGGAHRVRRAHRRRSGDHPRPAPVRARRCRAPWR